MRLSKGDAEGQKCLEVDEVQLLYHYFLNADFLYNVGFFTKKAHLCLWGRGR